MLTENLLGNFLEMVRALDRPRVLEIGTKRIKSQPSTIRKDWVPNAGEYIGTDAEPGVDVDVVSDVHSLSSTFGENQFDVIISCSVYEHIRYPWIATVEIARVLRLGGLVFIHTHNAYPLHGYPHDYWRYTTDSLEALFSAVAGFRCLGTQYEFPCKIVSDREPSAAEAPAYLNVLVLAQKVAHPSQQVTYYRQTQRMNVLSVLLRQLKLGSLAKSVGGLAPG